MRAIFLLNLLAACGAPEEEIGESQQALTQAAVTTVDPWEVHVQMVNSPVDKTTCSASVVSTHWVLTAAHCLQGVTSTTATVTMAQTTTSGAFGMRVIYNGPARRHPEPEYHGTWLDRDSS